MADFGADQKFQYKCPFRKAWVDCGAEEDQQLKEAYLKLQKGGGQPEVAYLLNGVRFKTDFSGMVRTNVASKRTMEVRLKGGSLPFPPPAPEAGASAPSEASMGKPDGVPQESDEKGAVPLSPEALMTGLEGKPFPHGVRKAWGQGLPQGVTMSGRFEFTMQLDDKDYLGEMLTWNMIAAGIDPEAFDSHRVLAFTNKNKQTVIGNREEIEKMLTSDQSYPITVTYHPPRTYDGMPESEVPGWEVQRTFLKFIKEAVANVDGDIYKVKHVHQRRTFERYLLYLEDYYYQNDDDLADSMYGWELYMRYPFMTGSLGLIDKTGPNLTKVLRGEADVLEFLFGG
uniref:WWE domain-containing protein n=1 Tax=Alexandrium monilatum TaxID=311494 RepID=A0A7S4SPL4_9DINO